MAMAVAVAVAVGYTARHVQCTSRAHTRASSPRMARAINVSLPHARSARARCGVVAAIARSLDHAHAVRGSGDGGGGGGQLIRASFASCASHMPFVSRACAASSPRVINVSLPSSPSRAIGTHALRRQWRSLARSIARAVWRWRWRWRSITTRVNRGPRITLSMHYSHTRRVIAARRARHHRFPFPPRSARALRRWRRSLARSLSRARCGGGCDGGSRLRRASTVPHASRSPCITHTHTAPSPRVARVIAVPVPPAHDRLARCGGGGARSLARSIARARGVAVAMAEAVGHAARHVHHASRARTRASLPRVPRIITVSIPRCHPRARAAAALSRLLARAVALAVVVGVAVAVEVAVAMEGYGTRSGACADEQARAMSLCACACVTAPLARGGGGGARSLARLPLRRSPRRTPHVRT